MRWERLGSVRTVLLILIGIGALVAAAWGGLGMWWGLAALGVSALFLEFLTGDRSSEPETGAQRR